MPEMSSEECIKAAVAVSTAAVRQVYEKLGIMGKEESLTPLARYVVAGIAGYVHKAAGSDALLDTDKVSHTLVESVVKTTEQFETREKVENPFMSPTGLNERTVGIAFMINMFGFSEKEVKAILNVLANQYASSDFVALRDAVDENGINALQNYDFSSEVVFKTLLEVLPRLGAERELIRKERSDYELNEEEIKRIAEQQDKEVLRALLKFVEKRKVA